MTIFEKNRALLEQFRAGDREALSNVYFFYIADIENLIRSGRGSLGARLFRDFDRRQDMVQEIFLRAFSASARTAFDGLRPYRPYLMSIARNAMIDYLRKLPKETLGMPLNDTDDEQLIAAISEGISSDGETTSSRESGVHWDRCLSAAQAYVSTLTERQKRFVDLRYKQELPQFTVAERLGMTRWKVRALEKKIETGLRKYLARAKLLDK